MATETEKGHVLDWYSWAGDQSVPTNEWLLCECEGDDYHIGRFELTDHGCVIGIVGGHFHFDRRLVRWASIQHLIDIRNGGSNDPQ